MGLETGTYIDDLVSTNPLAADNVSQGDNHLRLIKAVLKASFPSVDMAVNAIHASSSAPAVTRPSPIPGIIRLTRRTTSSTL